MRVRLLTTLVLAAGVVACGSSSTDVGSKWSDPATIDYYTGLHVNIARMTKTASGVFYYDSIAGIGATKVKAGDQLTVHYTLWLPDGTLLESNAFGPFTLSNTNVIQGWVDGLTGAVQGTMRQLVIPPALAYGAAGSGRIPPNSSIVFLVTVDRVVSASSDVAAVNAIAGALLSSGVAARFH